MGYNLIAILWHDHVVAHAGTVGMKMDTRIFERPDLTNRVLVLDLNFEPNLNCAQIWVIGLRCKHGSMGLIYLHN